MIHRTFDPPHQNCRSLSFVALERSSVPDMATPTGDDEVLTSRKSRRKHTSREITDAENSRVPEHPDTNPVTNARSP